MRYVSREPICVILHNDVYWENNSIDYKVNFAFLECLDRNLKKEKQIKVWKDVCSFVNAQGGYVFYGIGENSGMAGLQLVNIENQFL